MTDSIRKSFEQVFNKSADSMGMDLVYDVAHNIAKEEEHIIDGKRKKVYVHSYVVSYSIQVPEYSYSGPLEIE